MEERDYIITIRQKDLRGTYIGTVSVEGLARVLAIDVGQQLNRLFSEQGINWQCRIERVGD